MSGFISYLFVAFFPLRVKLMYLIFIRNGRINFSVYLKMRGFSSSDHFCGWGLFLANTGFLEDNCLPALARYKRGSLENCERKLCRCNVKSHACKSVIFWKIVKTSRTRSARVLRLSENFREPKPLCFPFNYTHYEKSDTVLSPHREQHVSQLWQKHLHFHNWLLKQFAGINSNLNTYRNDRLS